MSVLVIEENERPALEILHSVSEIMVYIVLTDRDAVHRFDSEPD